MADPGAQPALNPPPASPASNSFLEYTCFFGMKNPPFPMSLKGSPAKFRV